MANPTTTQILHRDDRGYVDVACGLNHSGSHDIVLVRTSGECQGCLASYTVEELSAAIGRPGQVGTGRLYDPRVS